MEPLDNYNLIDFIDRKTNEFYAKEKSYIKNKYYNSDRIKRKPYRANKRYCLAKSMYQWEMLSCITEISSNNLKSLFDVIIGKHVTAHVKDYILGIPLRSRFAVFCKRNKIDINSSPFRSFDRYAGELVRRYKIDGGFPQHGCYLCRYTDYVCKGYNYRDCNLCPALSAWGSDVAYRSVVDTFKDIAQCYCENNSDSCYKLWGRVIGDKLLREIWQHGGSDVRKIRKILKEASSFALLISKECGKQLLNLQMGRG